MSSSFTLSALCPLGKAVATEATWTPRIAEKQPRGTDEIWVNADRGAARHAVARVDRLHGFAAEVGHFARRVFSLERREVHHRDDQLQPCEFRRRLDAAFGEGSGAFLDHHLIDRSAGLSG